jgi:hypothetical protein
MFCDLDPNGVAEALTDVDNEPLLPEHVALMRGEGALADSAMMAFVFKQRLSGLKRVLKRTQILGIVGAFVWRIEYKRRGLPHAHILLWTDFDTDDLEAVDHVINVRHPGNSPILDEQSRVPEWCRLIEAYQ